MTKFLIPTVTGVAALAGMAVAVVGFVRRHIRTY